jgi:ADP-heptose synthase, bifunctional sugar kinase/adenylyltransferase
MNDLKNLLPLIPKLRGKKIAVYGDLIADEYVYGTINRFSREAPVFIVNYEQAEIRPGGAANAINNISELGGIPVPFGVLGNDQAGRTLLSFFSSRGIQTSGISTEQIPTNVKQRVVAGSPHSVKQQILRIDRCISVPSDSESHANLTQRALSMLDQIDAFVISDYGLGVAQPVRMEPLLAELAARGIPSFVDSRQNLKSYKNITAATPNEPEVEAIIGKIIDSESLVAAGKELSDLLQAKAIVITRGKNGMMLFASGVDPIAIPIFGSSDIVDVTGAGDTVISTFALAVAAGASMLEAAQLANCAAGIVVMKRGAATVSPSELDEAIRIASL